MAKNIDLEAPKSPQSKLLFLVPPVKKFLQVDDLDASMSSSD